MGLNISLYTIMVYLGSLFVTYWAVTISVPHIWDLNARNKEWN